MAAAPTFAALGAQVLSDVVMHTHVLLEHVLAGKGLPTLLTRVALHTCRGGSREALVLQPTVGKKAATAPRPLERPAGHARVPAALEGRGLEMGGE